MRKIKKSLQEMTEKEKQRKKTVKDGQAMIKLAECEIAQWQRFKKSWEIVLKKII